MEVMTETLVIKVDEFDEEVGKLGEMTFYKFLQILPQELQFPNWVDKQWINEIQDFHQSGEDIVA